MMKKPSEQPRVWARLPYLAAGATVAVALVGCHGPELANIELRKRVQVRDQQIDQLKRANSGLEAQIKAIQARSGATTQVSESFLDTLFTTHGLSLGSLTGGFPGDDSRHGDQGLQIFTCPTDDDGQPLKAAGGFVVEAFDLSDPGDTHVGRWTFSTAEARNLWNGHAFLYTYVLNCKWQAKKPAHAQLLVRVTFTDELSGRQFSADKTVSIKLPPPS